MSALPRIVIVGSSFAGYTAALKLSHDLGLNTKTPKAELTVITNTDLFLFIPSLIWVPFGLRKREDISFKLRPPLEAAGAKVLIDEAVRFDLKKKEVVTKNYRYGYEYLIVATGPKVNFSVIPGLGPVEGYTHSICTYDHAVETGNAWQELLKNPGPVVIGATQGAACFGAAYEFVLNLAYQIKKHGMTDKIPLTYVTAEPYVGHFGIGNFGAAKKMTEMFFKMTHIQWKTNQSMDHVEKGHLVLSGGEHLPFKFAMIIPSFLGVDAVRSSEGLGNASGFVEVNDSYRLSEHTEVFAAGVAVAVKPPEKTPVPCGVPKTGYLSEEMAKVAAHNIAAEITDGKLISLPFASIDAKCILDAGNTGVIMTSDHILEPRKHAWLIPGPEAHWAKLAFEKYFLETRKRGWA